MTRSPQQAFFVDLLSPERPHPGHGVRVLPDDPDYWDVPTLVHGTVEDRAQWGKRMFEKDLRALEVIGDDRVPWLHCWSGTEIFPAAFGSEVHQRDEDMPFALAAVHDRRGADALEEPDIFSGSLGAIFAVCDRMVELCGTAHPVRICDLQSPLDVAAAVWERSAFYLAMIEEPEAVHRLLRKITSTQIRFLAAFRARYQNVCLVGWPDVWMPPEWGVGMSEDEIGVISTGMMREFSVPYLQEIGATFGGISLHCCAAAQHQWAEVRALPNLRYLQFFSPPTDLQTTIDGFSGRAVLVPGALPSGPQGLDMVEACLARARPDTRFFFLVGAEDLDEAAVLAREVKRRCGRA